MVEVIYSARRDNFEDGKIYRNPRYFGTPLADGVDRVVVDGDWPAVVKGYESIGIDVEIAGAEKKTETDPQKMNVPDLREWLTVQGIEFDASAKKADLLKLIPTQDDGEKPEEIDNGADT